MTLYQKIVEEGYDALRLQLKYDGLDEWVIPGAPAIQKSIVFVPVEPCIHGQYAEHRIINWAQGHNERTTVSQRSCPGGSTPREYT